VSKEVDDFIDFVAHKHQSRIADGKFRRNVVDTWVKWFESVDCDNQTPAEPTSEYQQLLLNKYCQQGLEL